MKLQILDLAKNDLIEGYHFYEAKDLAWAVIFSIRSTRISTR